MDVIVKRLLMPISESRPAGDDLRYDSTYDRIKEARREDELLPQGVWQRDLKRANWAEVRDLCTGVLEKRSKDLQVAMWLMESLLHLDGFTGVRQGLELLISLCEKYWEEMYPEMGEDLETRLSPFFWMNEKLSVRLKFIPITRPQTDEATAYTWGDWESCCRLDALIQKDRKILHTAQAEGKPTRAKFLGSVMFTPGSFYLDLMKELEICIEHMDVLGGCLDAKCGSASPGLGKFRETLREIKGLVGELLQEKQGGEQDELTEMEGSAGGKDESRKEEGRFGVGTIRSRAEAYRMLSAAADYLLMTEPHSPTPYLVKRAVSWGNMTLTELLRELMSNKTDLTQIYTLLGISPPDKS